VAKDREPVLRKRWTYLYILDLVNTCEHRPALDQGVCKTGYVTRMIYKGPNPDLSSYRYGKNSDGGVPLHI
jgi:hypothetical protein